MKHKNCFADLLLFVKRGKNRFAALLLFVKRTKIVLLYTVLYLLWGFSTRLFLLMRADWNFEVVLNLLSWKLVNLSTRFCILSTAVHLLGLGIVHVVVTLAPFGPEGPYTVHCCFSFD